MGVFDEIAKKLQNEKLHFTLIDPDKQSPQEAGKLAKSAEIMGSDAIMVGGSSSTVIISIDDTVKEIKKNCNIPVILFPYSHAAISGRADAVFFMSLLNSRRTEYIIDEQVKGAPIIKSFGLEPISMAYIMIESGGVCTAQWVSDARLIPANKPEIAVSYAMAAELFGMKMIYLEAGSGAECSVPSQVISAIRKSVSLPIIVGGGVITPDIAKEKLSAGADIIVNGTVAERNPVKLENIIRCVKSF